MFVLHEQQALDVIGGGFWSGMGCGIGIMASIAAPNPFTVLATIAACGDALSNM